MPRTGEFLERTKDHRAGSFGFLPGVFGGRVLHDLRHEAAHRLRGLLLGGSCGVGIGFKGEAGVVVAQHGGDCLDVHAVLEGHGGEGVSEVVEPDVR